MAGLPYFVFAWMVAIFAAVGVLGVMLSTDAPNESSSAAGTTALATALFVVAVTATVAL